MNGQAVPGRKRSLWPLITLVIVFALPVIAAWFFYLNPQFLPATHSNRGELMTPQVALNDTFGLAPADGGEFDWRALDGRWTLVTLEAAPCGQDCRNRLIALRQIRLALGESSLSVERLLILAGSDTDATDLLGDFTGMHLLHARGVGRDRLLSALGEADTALGRIYIRDPMGNLMMRYAPDAPAKDTLKDMEHLLKASKNWIKGASYGHR
jgi:hypothetical protein